MSETLTYTRRVELVLVTCYTCSVSYGIPETMDQMLLAKKAGATTWCPNGHAWHYVGRTDAEKLRDAEARVIHERDQRHAAERQVTAYKGQMTRLRKRAVNGVCPCCKRTFANVARHMDNKHPDYEKDSSQ